MTSFVLGVILPVLAATRFCHAADVSCYVRGECLDSFHVDAFRERDGVRCSRRCRLTDGCNYFTHYKKLQLCYLFENCAELSAEGCSDCVAGRADCYVGQDSCVVEGVRCQGTWTGFITGVGSAGECQARCQATADCSWFTFQDGSGGVCTLTEDCPSVVECDDCTAGPATCRQEDPTTVLVVGGGYNDEVGAYLSDAEVVLLGHGQIPGDPGLVCDKPSDFPYSGTGMIGLTDSEGRPLVCGGFSAPDRKACFRYEAQTDSWTQGPSMLRERYYSGVARLSDGRQWLVGGGRWDVYEQVASRQVQRSSEYFDGEAFTAGPSLPASMRGPCAVEVDDGTVFVASYDAFLFDVASQVFTPLPPVPDRHGYRTCGAVSPSPLGGTDVVVLGEINRPASVYNALTGGWRTAGRLGLRYSPVVPFGRSFAALGGYDTRNDDVDAVHQYDPDDEDWIPREETLFLGRHHHAAVVVVDPAVLNCRRRTTT